MKGQLATVAMAADAAIPRPMPITPPMLDSVIASTRNCDRISSRRAPTAKRMPISRVLSTTETSMIFMMPIPPTTREMDAIAATNSASAPAEDSDPQHFRHVLYRDVVVQSGGESRTLPDQGSNVRFRLL